MNMQIEELPNFQIVTIAVAILGGDTDYIDREDVAVRANEIAPGRFNWRKYPEWIDSEVVGFSLRDAKKSKNGALLIGNNTQGWMLSPAGLRWFRTVDFSILSKSVERQYRRGSVSEKIEGERLRLRTTRAYKLFLEGKIELATIQDFYQFSRINEYFQTKSRERRYAVIENVVLGDDILTEIWSMLKGVFKKETE